MPFLAVQSLLITDYQIFPIAFLISQQGFINAGRLDYQLIFTALEKSPDSKEVRTNKLDAVH